MLDGKIVNEMRLSKFSGTDIDGRIKQVASRMQEIGI
jgi:putative ABC transport system ATP-binding protein